LVDAGGHEVEPLTPLLARAEGLELRPALRGELAGRPAVTGHLRYGHGHPAGAGDDASFEFAVAITKIPESAAFVPRLFCRDRGHVDSVGNVGMSIDMERRWTESPVLTSRYEVSTSPYQDRELMARLFSPEFGEWLTTVPPGGFGFELAYGDLVGAIPAAELGSDELAGLWDSTGEIAQRIRLECVEGRPQ
jgi:hypothetical protein